MAERVTGQAREQATAVDRGDAFRVGLLSCAHLVHDSYLSMLGILLPLLVAKLELSLFMAGLLAPIQQGAAVGQPFLGYLADRWNGRYFVIVCTAVTGLLMSLVGLAPNYLLLAVILFAAGMSSAAYHPAGSALLTRVAGNRWGSALAIYHLGGNLGLAVGPILVTAVVTRFDLESTYLTAVPALLFAFLLARFLPMASVVNKGQAAEPFLQLVRAESRTFGLLSVVILARAAGAGGLTLFLPTYLILQGNDFATAGNIAAGYFAVGGLGGLLTGYLSDRFSRKSILLVALLLSPVFLLTFLNTTGPLSIVCLLVAAALLLGEQPVLIALVQELSPTHRGTLVGFTMGSQFLFTGLATASIGALADQVGLGTAFSYVAVIPILGAPALLMLKAPRGAR